MGAGPAGLSAAIRLKQLQPSLSVCVLEKGATVGEWQRHCVVRGAARVRRTCAATLNTHENSIASLSSGHKRVL